MEKGRTGVSPKRFLEEMIRSGGGPSVDESEFAF